MNRYIGKNVNLRPLQAIPVELAMDVIKYVSTR